MTYEIHSPDGRRHTVSNISAFCRKYGLDRANMHHVINGARKHHRGFTCPDSGYYRIYAGERCKYPRGKRDSVASG